MKRPLPLDRSLKIHEFFISLLRRRGFVFRNRFLKDKNWLGKDSIVERMEIAPEECGEVRERVSKGGLRS